MGSAAKRLRPGHFFPRQSPEPAGGAGLQAKLRCGAPGVMKVRTLHAGRVLAQTWYEKLMESARHYFGR